MSCAQTMVVLNSREAANISSESYLTPLLSRNARVFLEAALLALLFPDGGCTSCRTPALTAGWTCLLPPEWKWLAGRLLARGCWTSAGSTRISERPGLSSSRFPD